nr:immunoglobulin light chain junction region [Macaca mulatta]
DYYCQVFDSSAVLL